MDFDYIIIGSGLTGATIGRLLKQNGKNVLILERRAHLGGNVYDHSHESGIRIHTYGPHYFRTSDEKIWNFVKKYAEFYEYVPELKSFVDGSFENWPIAGSYIKKHIGENWEPTFKGTPTNFEEAALRLMPELIYEKFIKGYNIKQWGVDSTTLDPGLVKRFDVREDDDPRLMPKHKYQGIPKEGYKKFMENLLAGIPVLLNCDYLKNKDDYKGYKKIIFTGPIDEYFNFKLGKLKYRGQKRFHEYLPNTDIFQPCGQVNNPDLNSGPHIRTLEWKHMMPHEYGSRIKGTVITREVTITPKNPEDYEYPFPDKKNRDLYTAYQALASEENNLLICGRLGEYRYYDMDQAIGRAMILAKKLLGDAS